MSGGPDDELTLNPVFTVAAYQFLYCCLNYVTSLLSMRGHEPAYLSDVLAMYEPEACFHKSDSQITASHKLYFRFPACSCMDYEYGV